MVDFCFVRPYGGHRFYVGNLPSFWNFAPRNEKDCVSVLGYPRPNTLRQLTKVIGATPFPNVGVWSLDQMILFEELPCCVYQDGVDDMCLYGCGAVDDAVDLRAEEVEFL